jgi:hypothetical protein
MRVLVMIFLLGAGGSYWLLLQSNTGSTGAAPQTLDGGARIGAADVPHSGLSRFFYSSDARHPCVGNRFCLVSYMAPWCPYCKRSLPAYRQMRTLASQSRELGVALVLSPAGRGFDGATSLAEGIAGPVYKDQWDQAWSVVKQQSGRISGVPAWAVYDADGRMVSSASGAVMQSGKGAIKRFLQGRMQMQGRLSL